MSEPSATNPSNPQDVGNQPPTRAGNDLRHTSTEPQQDAEGNPSLELHHAVVRGFVANGIDAAVDYPGCVVFELDPETTVWTGLESWTYGTIHRLQDGTMHYTNEPAEPSGIAESTEDPETIVAAWTKWVTAYHASADERH